MSTVAVLDKNKHKAIRIDVSKKAGYVEGQRLIPIVVSEFQRCANHYPIILMKRGEGDDLTCAAVLGFDEGENLFESESPDKVPFAPLNLQRQPFVLTNPDKATDDPEDFLLCIDEDSPCITKAKSGIPLFENDEPSEYLQFMQNTFAQLITGEKQTKEFVDQMVELGLIAPLPLNIVFYDGTKQRVDGAFTVSEEKLNALNSDQVFELHQKGFLGLIYAMFVSRGQFYPLTARKNEKLKKAANKAAKKAKKS